MKHVKTILAVITVLALAGGARAQPNEDPADEMTFSVDFQGPTANGPGPFTGLRDFFAGIPIDEGCILTPGLPGPLGPNPPTPPLGPLPPPGIMVCASPGGPGSVPGGLGVNPGMMGAVEVDALSYGRDALEGLLEQPVAGAGAGDDLNKLKLYFSVDEFAVGIPPGIPPDVASEGAAGGLAAVADASADVFMYLGPPRVAVIPPVPVFGNIGVVDGDAMPSASGFVYPGVGLIEPNPPNPQQLPDHGDNLDAVDMNTTMKDVTGLIYFSLDSKFGDPLEAIAAPPPNTGTALGNRFVGGDVLVTVAGGMPMLYAPAPMLGLDLVPGQGPDSDDLDALALWDDGTILLNGEPVPFFDLDADIILFSVRRGSAVIGMPDSRWNILIEEGDVLTVPIPGGVSAFPAIVIPAEAMGLATVRSAFPVMFGDDLDALDVVPEPGTMALLAIGGLGMLIRRRRR